MVANTGLSAPSPQLSLYFLLLEIRPSCPQHKVPRERGAGRENDKGLDSVGMEFSRGLRKKKKKTKPSKE